MKIYNKKGLVWGVLWTAAGLFSLYRDFVDPDSFWLQQGKGVVISAVMVLIGILGWGFIFITSGMLAGISILVELIVFIYYEHRS